MFCVSVKIWRHSHTHTHTQRASFFFHPEDVINLSIGAIWNFIKGRGIAWLGFSVTGTKSLSQAWYIRTEGARNHYLLYSSILPQPEFDPRFLGRPHCSLISKPAEVFRLSKWTKTGLVKKILSTPYRLMFTVGFVSRK